MIKALLVDLDHTLLQTNLEEFLPTYTGLLAKAIQGEFPTTDPVPILLSSIQAMIANQDPARTLQRAFGARFYLSLGISEAELAPSVERFYKQTYPELRMLTAPMPGALDLIKLARKLGLRLGLATNPLFPRTAIEQRLEWAGLDPSGGDFDVVACIESFHFTKPHPEFFAEMLGQLGVEPECAAMVGDDPRRDIEPARRLGLQTFMISQETNGDEPLAAARAWLEDLSSAESNPETHPSEETVLAKLKGYLSALLQLAPDPEDHRWHERPSPREWAPVEIVCHLRDTEREVNHRRLRRLLSEDTPFISAVNPDDWAEERKYLNQDPQQALREFARARTQTIAQLAQLEEERWTAPARHALLGPITLLELMGVAADHDLLHLDQLRGTLNQLAR